LLHPGGDQVRSTTPVLLVLAALLGTGCAPRDATVRLARVEAEKRNLEAAFDQLEDRLLVNQARVRFWREMRDRHESVSAIACASLEEHAYEMARGEPAHSSLHRARVASVSPAEPAAARVPAVR
jgi:hypothetical protein